MIKKSIYFLLVTAIFIIPQCGKKDQRKESILVQKEEFGVQVPIPSVDWIKTLIIQSFKDTPSSSRNHTLFEELTSCTVTRLSEIRELKVLVPGSFSLYQILKQKADYMLTGEGEFYENRIILFCRLVDLRKNSNLWEKSFDNNYTAIYDIAKQISDSILSQLKMNNISYHKNTISHVSVDVLNPYLEGKFYFKKDNRIAADLAIQNFKKTLRIDSTFIPAWIALGETYLNIYDNRWNRNMVWFHLAQQTAFKALQWDSACAEARLVLGRVYYGLGDYKQAEGQFRKAIAQNSNLKDAWFGLGTVLSEFGLYPPSLAVFGRVLEIDPSMSMASIGKAMVLIGLKHYAEAEAVLQQTLEKKPEATFIHSYLALTQYYQNNLKQAQVTIAKGLKSDDNRLFSHTIQAMIFAKADKLDQALGELELNVIPYLHDDPSLSVAVSAVYALLNRPGLSVQWLERAFQYGYKQVPWLESDPNFNAIRKDERFITLLKTARKDWEKQTNAGSSN